MHKILGIAVAMVITATAMADGEPKLYVIGKDIKGVDKGAALEAVAANGLSTMVYECKQQIKGRKGLENVSGSSVFVVGQVSGTTSKWDATVAVAAKKGVALCTRKVVNEQTANFKNF
jgi:hypothetical protein